MAQVSSEGITKRFGDTVAVLAFTKAGLNPNSPPTTLSESGADAKALNAAGSGTALKLNPWHLETWLSTAIQTFVNNSNGSKGRATNVAFQTKPPCRSSSTSPPW